jgi:hypothetical protein
MVGEWRLCKKKVSLLILRSAGMDTAINACSDAMQEDPWNQTWFDFEGQG